MNTVTLARQSELDRALDAIQPSSALAEELFALVELLASETRLRSALSDPTMPDAERKELAAAVLADKLSESAFTVLAQAVTLKWGSGARLVQVLQRQAIRVLLSTAQQAGQLDTVEEELFRLGRTVTGSPELRKALDDRGVSPQIRRKLIVELTMAKAQPITVALASQAVQADSGGFEHGIEDLLQLAAAARQRVIATVTVARPLTEQQRSRLEAVLVAQLGRQVNLQVVIDPGVIGGAKVQVGDQVIEGTVASRLAAAKRQLTK